MVVSLELSACERTKIVFIQELWLNDIVWRLLRLALLSCPSLLVTLISLPLWLSEISLAFLFVIMMISHFIPRQSCGDKVFVHVFIQVVAARHYIFWWTVGFFFQDKVVYFC